MSDPHDQLHTAKAFSAPAIQRIVEALQGIRFGAVEIVIHDGRVVQIERKEKVRFAVPSNGRANH